MNLKDAFRCQNKLNALSQEVTRILTRDANVTKTETTCLRSKVMPDAQDETVVETAPSELADKATQLVEFLIYLLNEREKLYTAIHEAKQGLALDFDSAAGMNNARHAAIDVLRRMADLRATETVVPNGGVGYCFNVEHNQVSYKCDLKRVTKINFDRNKVRRYLTSLNKAADDISAAMDCALINTVVAYELPFDVNDTFTEIFGAFCEA